MHVITLFSISVLHMSTRKYVGAPDQMEIKALMNFVIFQSFPVDTRRRFNVYKTSIRRRGHRIDVL